MTAKKNNDYSCMLCGSRHNHVMFRSKYGKIRKCLKCGLIFLKSNKESKDIQNIYNNNYYNQKNSSDLTYSSYLDEKPIYINYFKNKINQINKLGYSGKILDVGCGLGYFLEVAKRRGWETEGVDLSEYAVSYVSQTLKIKVHNGDFEKCCLPKNSYDVVTLFSAIEHFNNPLKVLRKAKYLLKPGGLLLLTAADQGGLMSKITGRRWFQYKYKGHLFFFSSKTLKIMMEKAGFKDLKIEKEEWHFFPLDYLFSRLIYLYPLPFLKKLNGIKFFKKLKIPFLFDYLLVTAKN